MVKECRAKIRRRETHMLPRSKHILIIILFAIALLAGLSFARFAGGACGVFCSAFVQGVDLFVPKDVPDIGVYEEAHTTSSSNRDAARESLKERLQ